MHGEPARQEQEKPVAEGEEGVVSGWIAAFVKAAAARRMAERRIDVGELIRVDEEERRRC